VTRDQVCATCDVCADTPIMPLRFVLNSFKY
jgi:hypothetical protein